MVILALDSTTQNGSVALSTDGVIETWQSDDLERTHGERLPGEVLELLEAQGTAFDEVELLGVCLGPGSFTGLRV